MAAPRPEFQARYWVESPEPLDRAAEVIAGEQSSGTFLAVPGETDALKKRSRARVLRVDPLPSASAPSLASAHVERRHHPGPYHTSLREGDGARGHVVGTPDLGIVLGCLAPIEHAVVANDPNTSKPGAAL